MASRRAPARGSEARQSTAIRERMTDAQASQLKRLSRLTREPEAFSEHLSKEAAAKRIEVLRAKVRKDVGGAQHKA